MPDFSTRSAETELLDREDIPFDDIRKNMEELDVINTRLGGHRITIAGIRKLLKPAHTGKLHILEIGCGGGDNLRVIKKYCEASHIQASYTGIDKNPHCIAFARSRSENAGIHFITSDYRTARIEQKPDIIFSSLFCHHFTDDMLTEQLQWMHDHSSTGFFINDLHRHPVAYYSIKWLTRLLSGSYLVKNDAPISVLRGFNKKEWKNICHNAGLENVRIQWRWAFRWLLIHTHA